MAKKSKKYIEALNQIEKGKAYTKEEAVELVKKVSTSKFDGSVEVAMKLNLDTRKSDQQLRGAIVLPNGTGKTKRILVLSKTNQAQIAKEAGADFVGDADLVEKIEKENWLDFDVIIATPEMMPMLGKLGKVLGPRGLMPNPKTGTVTTDVKKAIDDIKKGLKKYEGAARRLEYKGKFKGASVYDDYGHHPTEIKAVVESIRNMKFNESWVIFEPHTYARAYKHKEDFAKVLKDFDHIIITDIYAAREENIFGIKEEDIIKEIKKYGKEAFHISSYDDIKLYLSEYVNKDDLILTLGAGNVTKLASMLIE